MNSNVLYIDKPSGISSFDICYKLRKVLNTKKIGHTGTLDPNATGVMIILYNQATKAAQFLVSDKKTYKARVLLGVKTDTLDIDGKILENKAYQVPKKADINYVLNSFIGKSKQVVPITSAKKINGKKLYEYQQKEQEVELPVIDIEVFNIYLNEIYDDGFEFTCEVSAGTYVRALARDILEKLGQIGTLSKLCRTCIDDINLQECDELNDVLNGKYRNHNLLDVLSKRYKTYEVNNVDDIKNGKRIKIESDEEYLLLINNNEVLAMYQKDNDEYKSVRGLW